MNFNIEEIDLQIPDGFKCDKNDECIRFRECDSDQPYNPLLTSVLRAISRYWQLVTKICCDKDPLSFNKDSREETFKIRLFNKFKNNFEVCIFPGKILYWKVGIKMSLTAVSPYDFNLWPLVIETCLAYWTKNMRDLYYLIDNPNNLFTALTGMGCIVYPSSGLTDESILSNIIHANKVGRIVMFSLLGRPGFWYSRLT